MWAVLLYYMRNQCLAALSRSCLYIYIWGSIHTVQSAPDKSFPFPSQLCPGSGAASFSIAVDGLSLLRVMQVGPHCIKVFCLISGVCVCVSCSIVPRCGHTPVSTMKCTSSLWTNPVWMNFSFLWVKCLGGEGLSHMLSDIGKTFPVS